MFYGLTGSFWSHCCLPRPPRADRLSLERLVFRHLYARTHLEQVLATFGIILTLNEAARTIWGAAPLQLPMPELLTARSSSWRAALSDLPHCLILASLAVAGGLAWAVNHTRAGMLIRAGASNAEMVASLGVDIGGCLRWCWHRRHARGLPACSPHRWSRRAVDGR